MKVEINDVSFLDYDGKSIRLDFSNGRRYKSTITPPYGAKEVSEALIRLARAISIDETLIRTN